jgi:hypothetical protein
MIKSYVFHLLLFGILLNYDANIQAQTKLETMKNYTINIDIFRKGNYKIFSIQLKNREFLAAKHSTVNQTSDTLIVKILSAEEAAEIENFIKDLSLESLQDEYINRGVKGEHHLVYSIAKDDQQKDIFVYYQDEPDLRRLYEKLMALVPEDERIWYFR